MKRLVLLTTCALLAVASQVLIHCSSPLQPTDGASLQPPLKVVTDTVIEYDTIYSTDTIFGTDTVIVVDTIIGSDTVVVVDTFFNGDTIYVIDTVLQNDTIIVVDTIFSSDTVFVYDTTYSTDTLVIIDTVYDTDTSYIYDTVFSTDTMVVVDTIYNTDTIYVIDTLIDSLPPDTVIIHDTVEVVIEDSTGIIGLCDVLSPQHKKISWIVLAHSGDYRLDFAATAKDRPCQTLIIDIDEDRIFWDPYAEPNLSIERPLASSFYLRIYPEKPNCFGHEVGVCVRMTRLNGDGDD